VDERTKTRAAARNQRSVGVMAVAEPTGPTGAPPSAVTDGTGAGMAEPKILPEEALADATAAAESRPVLAPPSAAADAGAGAQQVTATWRTGTVTALWSMNQTRNAWMHVPGIGWRKLFNGRDWSFTALVTLASQARQTSRQIAFREEADGMVYEIYLW
jgi:hypothetical protein